MSRTSGFRMGIERAVVLAGAVAGATVVACTGGEAGPAVEVVQARVAPITNSDVAVAIVSPQAGEVVQNPVQIEVVLGGFELGVPTEGASERGILKAEEGQHLHVIVDDDQYISVFDASEPITLPELSPGPHVVRVSPALQWHEAVKGPGAFEAVQFYVGEETGDLPLRPGAPLLTFIRPFGTYRGAEADSILLDFVVRNANVGIGGYKVRLSVDGEYVQDLTRYVPYFLVGLAPGEHVVELQLRDAGGRVIPGAYNTSQRTITIEP